MPSWKVRCITSLGFLASTAVLADDSQLTVGANSIQRLAETQLFSRNGRWYLLDDGPCYAYLEYPKTHFVGDRMVLDAHLSSRMGLRAGDSCLGSGFASNVTLSGRAIGKGPALTLDDIRVDHVEDSVTGTVLSLIQRAAPRALPRALSLDVLAAARGTPINAAGIPVTLLAFRIMKVEARPGAVVVHFDMSLSTP